MGRHSKNAGGMGSEALTYNERRALGFGTVRERLGKDAQGNFYDCRLTFAPVVDPLCTPSGYLFSKEAIYENLLAQKKANKKKLKVWEVQEKEKISASKEKMFQQQVEQQEAFYRQNHEGTTSEVAATTSDSVQKVPASNSTSATKEEKGPGAELKAFWLPSKTPEALKTVDKPSMECKCPATGEKLRLKDFFPVHFKRDPEGKRKYLDPLTLDELSNKDILVAIKPTGDIVKKSTYLKLIKPDGEFKGKKIGSKDIIEIQSGGTGFAAHDKHAQASKHFDVGRGSGLADLRGQSSGAVSRFGLRFTN